MAHTMISEFQLGLFILGNYLSLVLAALLFRVRESLPAIRYAAPLFACSVGYSLVLLHETRPLPLVLLQVGIFLNACTAPLSWLFGRALIQDAFRPRSSDWLIVSALLLLVVAADLDAFGVSWRLQAEAEALAFVVGTSVLCYVFYIALAGFRDDLLDISRMLRIWFLLLVASSYGVLLVLHLARADQIYSSLFYDMVSVVIATGILLWAGSLDLTLLERRETQTQPPQPSLGSARDSKAHARLIALMEEERLYREPGLSIGFLAEKVGVPEHRLRSLINTELGHRNFSEFLNGYRLEEARVALTNPAEERSILAIALDAGYQSLSTFNRAFRRRYDEAPSDVRGRSSITGSP